MTNQLSQLEPTTIAPADAIVEAALERGPISRFMEEHFLHFNAATLVEAARAYEDLIEQGGKMLVAIAGAMSTAELGKSLAEMIRKDKVHIISCTGANLEEDVMNLVAHSHYKRIPNWRDLTPEQERQLLEERYNRVTDTCIPEEEAFSTVAISSRTRLEVCPRARQALLPARILLSAYPKRRIRTLLRN